MPFRPWERCKMAANRMWPGRFVNQDLLGHGQYAFLIPSINPPPVDPTEQPGRQAEIKPPSQDRTLGAIILSSLSFLSSFSIHALPLVITGLVLEPNLNGYFVGAELAGSRIPFAHHFSDEDTLNVLQIFAKIHEIAIISSISALVWDGVRYWVHNDGLPLGLLGAAYNYTQGPYFVSRELLAFFTKSDRWSYLQRILLVVFLFFLCFTANSVGPASAILMLPRNETWPTAEYQFYVNGTQNDLWPSVFGLEHIGPSEEVCGNFSNAILNPSCNAGGFSALSQYVSSFKKYPEHHSFTFDTQDELAKLNFEGDIRNGWSKGSETWIKAPHMATVMVQEPLRARWSFYLRSLRDYKGDQKKLGSSFKNNNLKSLDYSQVRTSRARVEIPVVRTACAPMQVYEHGIGPQVDFSKPINISFPKLPEYEAGFFPSPDMINSANLFSMSVGETGNVSVNVFDRISAVAGSLGPSTQDDMSFVTQWVPIPDQFGSVSTGLAIMVSRRDLNGELVGYKWALGCSIDARWTRGENWVTTSRSDWGYAGYSQPHRSTILNRRTPEDDYSAERHFLPINDGSWRRISLTPAWLEALAPQKPGRNTTTIGVLLEDQTPKLLKLNWLDLQGLFNNSNHDLAIFAEHIVSTVVVDGIARVGTHLQPTPEILSNLYGEIPDSEFSLGLPLVPALSWKPINPTLTRLDLTTEIHGYAYKPFHPRDSGIITFAVIILLFHCLIVVIHFSVKIAILVRTYRRRQILPKSSIIATVSDLMVLAFISEPPKFAVKRTELLTAAGEVRHWDTLSSNVRVASVVFRDEA